MMWKYWLGLLAMPLMTLYAATDIRLDFEQGSQAPFAAVKPDGDTQGRLQRLTPEVAEGVGGGMALDLSARAALRSPVVCSEAPDYAGDFSFSGYVRTLPGAPQGGAIAGNIEYKDTATPGWLIYAPENGAWAVRLQDGKNSYVYAPTARQTITDGLFHQLGFAVDRARQEIRFYYDGKCRAIYRIRELGALGEPVTVLGGSRDKDYYGQEFAFNGMLDQIAVTGAIAGDLSYFGDFQQYFPERSVAPEQNRDGKLRVMEWNIWGAGYHFGRQVGLERTLEVILAAQPDIVTVIETYGNGEALADALGFQLYLISPNLSILSRYPIAATIPVFRPDNAGGVILELGEKRRLAVFDIWLHYLPAAYENIQKGEISNAEIIAQEEPTRHSEIKQILKEIAPYLAGSDTVPVILSGDFNSGSELDWTPENTALHQGYVIAWPVSRTMREHGFVDSFRLVNPNLFAEPGLTWSPWMSPGDPAKGRQFQPDRIDFIYTLGGSLQPVASQVIDFHPVFFPSDHAALVTDFVWEAKETGKGNLQ